MNNEFDGMSMAEIGAALDNALQEALIESQPELAGWTYRDLPRMTKRCLDDLIGVLGESNIKFITFADYGNNSVRGQVMISPDGMNNLKEFCAWNN